MTWIQPADLLPQVLRRRANNDPDELFLRHVDGSSETYGQTYEASLRWANALSRLGVTRGDNVLLMLPNSFEAYHAWLGLSWVGAVEVSLNTAYQGRMLTYTVEASDAKVMLVSQELLPRVTDIADQLEKLETIVVVDGENESASTAQRIVSRGDFFYDVVADPDVAIEPQPWDICCVIWTSGTTGPSKGVMLPWAEMYRFNEIITSVTGSDEVYYHFMPPFHIGGKLIISAAAEQAGSVVIRPVFSSSKFWDDVRNFGCTHVNIQGPMVRMLMNAPENSNDRDNSLRTMGCAPLPADLVDFHDRFGIRGTNTYYGMTEIGLPIASRGFDLADLNSCGRLRDGYEVRIVDEYDYPVAAGEVGELIVRADHPWVMNAGYYGRPQETAESWRNGWFHTGDAFRVDKDGNFYFVDRFKDALRRRGENISSFEVESQVGEHPDVLETAAVAVPSELGEDDVMIYVVRGRDSELTEPELHAWLVERMPKFMRPRYIEFLDTLPKTDATLRTKKIELRNRGLSVNAWDFESANPGLGTRS
ncbi:crotonobetaine/carnitine-CoA ligase [Tamaricihabitans halophyticus]|uniref:Crotonobetaine/carnitine-CoA ligase n=1 Tax=Tamaricihabitans halophyticus TaxID=1262583 RepID=A0A4R2QJQ4_9PSEU|nr:AMP-binding protein [Tamaricihabitans halophyticus]TCP47261.1 crotonobetaine/carnitine-CoA ligase [Tamaricihabitans halophyticus]